MTDPRELQPGDHINIDAEAISGVGCRVSDTQVEDIGITETFAVTLVSESEGAWIMTGTTADTMGALNELDGDREERISFNDISLE